MSLTRAGSAVLLFFLVPLACAQQTASYDTGADSLPRPAYRYDPKDRPAPVFERVVNAADGDERWIGRAGRRGIAIERTGFILATVERGEPSAAYRAFEFVGANAKARIEGLEPQPEALHRLVASPTGPHLTSGQSFARVRVADVYPGIDVVFYGDRDTLEYDVVVAPGADASAFALATPNAVARIDADGDLLVGDAQGDVRLRRPRAYQLAGNERITVDSAFTVQADGSVKIRVGSYDRTRPLVIDPVISYATSVGGNAFEQGTAIAVDAAGNAYVAGYTLSSNFPTLSAFDGSIGRKGDVDVFVTKMNAAGTALVWSTYLGATGAVDRAIGIAVDAAGNAYVTGSTDGTTFPVTAAAWQTGTTGGGAFVAKLGATGNTLVYSTYVAGVTANAIAVDRQGFAYVAGRATPSLPATPSAFQQQPGNAAGTGFVLKLDASGHAPVYATFLGGSVTDEATSIAVDDDGNAYVGGWTLSSDFPVANALQAAPRGQMDAFVAKLDPSGSRLVYSTRLGGALDDAVNAVAIDASGNAYVAGETYSADFPVQDAFQPTKAGARLINSSTGSAFVAKIGVRGNTLVYASFIGGEVCTTPCQAVFGAPQYRADAAYGIAVDAAGHAYVSGIARSYTFPLVDSASVRKQDDTDDSAFVAKVSVSGRALLWSTFVRTGFNEANNHWTRFPPGSSTGIAVDGSGAAYVTGDADGASNFVRSSGAYQSPATDGQGAFLVKFAATPSMTLTTSSARVDAQAPVTLIASVTGPPATGDVVFVNGSSPIGTAPLGGNRASLLTTLPVGIHALGALVHTAAGAVDAPVVFQVVEPSLACN